MQPFGYARYQRDQIAGTYYAQAREYQAENGRFAGQDLIAGFMDMPFSMNRYSYCFNSPVVLVDLDDARPKWVKEIGSIVNDGIEAVKDVWHWIDESVIHKYIIGNDITIYKIDLYGGTSENMPFELPNDIVVTNYANLNWSYSFESRTLGDMLQRLFPKLGELCTG